MANPQLMTGLGAALSIFLSASGASLASIPASAYAVHPKATRNVFFAFAPIVISGVLAIYGAIIAVILAHQMSSTNSSSSTATVMSETDGYRHFASGLTVGLGCLASGMGLAGFLKANLTTADTCPSTTDHRHEREPLMSDAAVVPSRMGGTPMIPTIRFLMVLTFLEAIGLYSLIVALFLAM
jgi:F0F1-type ATP synthase membrane subunit c/vacuolar-type H+-ATPase subunit K